MAFQCTIAGSILRPAPEGLLHHRKSLRVWLPWLLVAALPWLSGCEPASQPFRVGIIPWIGNEPLYLAQTKGYFGSSPIRLVTMRNATEVQQALWAGVLEAATLTLDEALTLRAGGVDLRIILVMDSSEGADVLMALPGIRTLTDLKGRRIGVESTAVGAVMLQGALTAAGLSAADVQQVYLTSDQAEAAYREGWVDAVVAFEPVRSRLLEAGAQVLFDSSRIPGRVMDVLVTTPEVAQRDGRTIERLIAGHFRARADLQAAPLEAAATMTDRLGISAQEVVASYRGLHLPDLEANRRYLEQPNPALGASAERLARLMVEQRLLERPVSVQGLFDDRFLPR